MDRQLLLIIAAAGCLTWYLIDAGAIGWIKSAVVKTPVIPDVSDAGKADTTARYLKLQALIIEARPLAADSPKTTEALNTALQLAVELIVGAK